MPRRPSQFEFQDEFATFLPAHGVPKAGSNYLSWMKRAVRILGRSIGPNDLSSDADVEALMRKLIALDQQRLIKTQKDESNQVSTHRKYAQMVQANYRGLFTNVTAAPAPVANDADEARIPARVKQTVHRIVRDTAISRAIKRLYEFRCQVCGLRLEIEPGVFYAEAHHLQPLGGEHQGKDLRENLLCLCPNHHALFDYFAIRLVPATLKLNMHPLGQSFVDYHNART